MKKTLTMMAGIFVLLGLGASAFAHPMQGLIYVGNGVYGKGIAECNTYQPIYAYGRGYNSRGAVVCRVYAYNHSVWTSGTDNCDTALNQMVVLRNSTSIIASGTWVPTATAISYAVSLSHPSMVDTGSGWSACEGRDMLGYSMVPN